MTCRLDRVLVLTACLLLAAFQPAEAAKVVRFLSPTTDTIWFKGSATGLTWDAGTTPALKSMPDGWLGYTFPEGASTPAGNYGFTTRDYSTQYQLNVDFTKGDTAWVFPDPFPTGSARVVYTHPRTKVVMFWNPWEYDAKGKPPRLQLEGGTWNAMTSSSALPGWYAYEVRGFTALSLAFSDSSNTKYVGAAWGLPAPFTVPAALVDAADTIWVRPTPELSGGLVPSVKRPAPKVVMVFNPWDGRLPVHHPRVSFGGGASLPMVASGVCGWYSFDFFDRPTTVLFSDDHGGQTFGAAGLGSSAAIDLAATLAGHDTAWVARDASSGAAKVKFTYSGEKGHCERVLLAATIRDFPSDGSNREFAPGRGCQRGGWGGIKGMVTPFLDAERKPIRSPYDTGWNGVPNSWGGREFGFRCTYDTMPGLQAEIGDSGISRNWFRTVPGKNAETCRDIPLVTDSVTGDYTYDNQHYFPIDDFTTLADGSRNPYNALQPGDDGKKHNYGFCLESHGQFEYAKGQVFDFRGDDDVWFFIGGRLVVDLGGIHPPWADSVLLDSIRAVRTLVRDANGQVIRTHNQDSAIYVPTDSSLVVGKTYDFDFFFCERNPQGSSMRIRTDMNLRTLAGFQMRDTARADGTRTYDLWVSRTAGQGCAARGEVTRTVADKIRLSGPSATPPVLLLGGVHYGGITVASDLGSFKIDTANIVGLAPGRYELAVVSPTDSTDVRTAVFVVPWSAFPKFVAKPPYAGSVGSSFPVEIASFNDAGPDSSAVAFQVRPVPGLRWFLDSLLTRPIRPDSLLRTPAGHKSVRLWVRGDSAGTYTLVTGRSATDSTDFWSNVEFLDKGLRFVDAAGTPVVPGTAIVRDVGDTVRLRVEAYNGASVCLACTDSLVLAGSIPGLVFLDSLGRPAVGIRLKDGKGSFLVVGTTAVENASVSVTSLSMGKTIVRTPLSFRSRTLVWIDATGQELTSTAVDTTVLSVVGPWRLEARGVDGRCLACTQSVRLGSTLPGIVFLDSATGRPVDSVRLAGGRVSVRVTSTRAVAGASLVGHSPLLDSAVLPRFVFRAPPPDSGAWYDDDGDGAADRAVVGLRLPWTPATSLQLSWPDTASRLPVVAPAFTLSPDSLVLTFRPATPLPGTASATESVLGEWSRDGGAAVLFPMRDKIAPVATKARLHRGASVDTLKISPSEPLSGVPAGTTLVSFLLARPGTLGAPLSAFLDPVTGELALTYLVGTSPEPGDSVRFAQGGVADVRGNTPGVSSRRVVIVGSERPPRDAVMLDVDGDGRADRVVLHFPAPVAKVSGYRFRWGSSDIALEERVVGAIPTDSDSGNLVLGFDLPPYAPGATSCPPSGCSNLGTMFAPGESLDTVSASFSIRDGVAPVLVRARLRYASQDGVPDTLLASFSEPVAATGPSRWISWNQAANVPVERAVPSSASTLSPDGLSALLLVHVDSSFWPLKGDFARISSSGDLVDAVANAPGAVSAWVPIEFGPHPLRFDARPYPSMRVVPSGSVPAAGETPLRILLNDPVTGAWKTIGGDPVADTSLLAGILLSLNAPLSGTIYLYDNLGTYVGSIGLAELSAVFTSPQLASVQDGKGLVRAWVSWNGTSAGRPVADGVYTIRLVGYPTDGTGSMINRLYRIGRKHAP